MRICHKIGIDSVFPFCVDVQVSSGDKNQRMKDALTTMGASVFRLILFVSDSSVYIFLLISEHIRSPSPFKSPKHPILSIPK